MKLQEFNSVDDLKHAAEEGNAVAQYMLGTCFFCGHGVEKDEKKHKNGGLRQ